MTKICQDETVKHLNVLLACRLILLDKKPGVRPTGVELVLRRIIGRIVMKLLRRDVLNATGSLHLRAGQDAGSEASIQTFYEILHEEDKEAVLMVDVQNDSNSINR